MTGPLTKQIAASHEDVQSLLDNNRSLSVSLLAHWHRDQVKATKALEATVRQLAERLDQAAVKFKEMRQELDQVKNGGGE